MIGRTALVAMLTLGATPLASAWGAPPSATPTAHVVVIHMVDKGGGKWAFEPADVQAQAGDTVRFLQTDIVPHNVQFKGEPKGAKLGAAIMGPFLLKKGDTYDLVIDARFVPGTYHFVCTPHEMMGMKGTLEVGSGADPDGTGRQSLSLTPSGGIR